MTTIGELRQALGRTGIWMPPPARIGLDPGEYARAIERAGFGSVWIPGVDSPAALEAMEPLLAATERLVAATGIANVWTWSPAELAAQADALADRYPGRFILGLGVSHAPRVESTGQAYVRPLAKMREFLDALPAERAPVVLAALGPKMLELSRDRTFGAHPYFSPPVHTAFARSVLGPEPLLIPEQAISLAGGSEGLVAGRAYAKHYLELPNYVSNLRRFGFGDDDLTGGGSDELISAIIPAGPALVRTRVREHLDAGADHVLLQPVAENGRFAAGQLDELASLLEDLLRPLAPVSQHSRSLAAIGSRRYCSGLGRASAGRGPPRRAGRRREEPEEAPEPLNLAAPVTRRVVRSRCHHLNLPRATIGRRWWGWWCRCVRRASASG